MLLPLNRDIALIYGQNECDIKRKNVDWKTKNLTRSFTHPALFNALGHDYSQRAPVSTIQRFFFQSGTDRARASTELIYYGSRNVLVMLTPVIGNNVCRERIEKERKGERKEGT